MLEEVVILPMALTDLDDIIDIELLSFTVPWSRAAFIEELLFNNVAMYFVARDGNKAVGYSGIWEVVGEGHITNVAVHPNYRGQGIAKKLLENLIAFADEKYLERLYLEVRVSNISAQGLYKSFGFKEDGIRKKYYLDNGEDALLMSRILSNNAE